MPRVIPQSWTAGNCWTCCWETANAVAARGPRKQLRNRRDELTDVPQPLPEADLRQGAGGRERSTTVQRSGPAGWARAHARRAVMSRFRSPRHGARTGPGPPSTYVRSGNDAPTRSSGTPPPTTVDTVAVTRQLSRDSPWAT